ncbi:dipeptidase [Propionibacteriaceae bacterium Y2011]
MTDLAATVESLFPEVLDTLTELVAIESISSLPDHADVVERSADTVAQLLVELGCPEVSVRRTGGSRPAVIAHFPAPEGMPTVCLYAHHDVQPTGDPAAWSSPPFTATRRGDRLYGRGTSDDKGGLAVHLAALRAFDGKPPVGVKLFIEGEEEVGSPAVGAFLDRHAADLAADLFVICDSANWEVGTPAFTTTLRGLADCVVEVSTLDHALHSGSFGGVVPDALTTLCRVLATLHDEQGNVAVAGLGSTTAAPLDYPDDRLAAEAGLLPGVSQLGDGPVVDRMWTRPSVSVLAIDATPVADASNTLSATARAKVSLRVAPGDDAARALDVLADHLVQAAPWGARVDVVRGDVGQPSQVAPGGRFAGAAAAAFEQGFGVAPVEIGQGGSIPMVAELQRRFPEAGILITAVGDPDTRAHGIDESVHLSDLAKACVSETLLLQGIADQVRSVG